MCLIFKKLLTFDKFVQLEEEKLYHNEPFKANNTTKSLNLFSDIDECLVDTPPCDQRCVNGIGSYHCVCYDGYVMAHGVCKGKILHLGDGNQSEILCICSI